MRECTVLAYYKQVCLYLEGQTAIRQLAIASLTLVEMNSCLRMGTANE